MFRLLACLCLAGIVASPPQDDLKPGLLGEYYEIGEEIDDFPSLKGMKPALRRIDRQIDFAVGNGRFGGTPLIDQFFVRWTGVLRVPKQGKYMFYLESDDGSRLLIGGKLVVDNNGLHGMEERSGDIDLKAGDHDLRVEFYDNFAGAGCRLRWDSGEINREIVPAEALFHRRDKDLDK